MKDYFDILGINGREDSFTDLIVAGFDDSENFRKNFCKYFANYYHPNFQLKSRSSFVSYFESRSKKDVPDLLLFNEDEIVLIEVKIFSKEGHNQTDNYSLDIFIVNVKKLLQLPNAKFNKFYYLTLDGTKAKSTKFENVIWKEFVENIMVDIEFKNTRLTNLFEDLRKRIIDFDSISELSNENLVEYMSQTRRWISHSYLFKNYFHILETYTKEKFDLDVSFGSANNKNGEQFLIIFSRKHWLKAELPKNIIELSNEEQSKYSVTRNIHIELNWTPNLKKMNLYIHYETNPYKTRLELEKLSEFMVKDYSRLKDEFKMVLYRNIPENWQRSGNFLTQIKTSLTIDEKTTKNDIHDWLIKNIELAIKAIETALEAID